MHDSVAEFARRVLCPDLVAGATVLEVGSRNVNGSLRGLVCGMGPASYLGLDPEAGPGVDEVVAVEEWTGDPVDLVICTEMLEHAPDWRAAVSALRRLVRPGGHLLLTTRSPGFPRHEHPADHWRFALDDIRAIFGDWSAVELEPDPQPGHPGVLALLRRSRRRAPDLDAIEVEAAP